MQVPSSSCKECNSTQHTIDAVVDQITGLEFGFGFELSPATASRLAQVSIYLPYKREEKVISHGSSETGTKIELYLGLLGESRLGLRRDRLAPYGKAPESSLEYIHRL